MKLSDAENLTANHPPAGERVEMLRDQVVRFRREFYGHLSDLRRIASWEHDHRELPTVATAQAAVNAAPPAEVEQAHATLRMVQGKQRAEDALDTIHHAIASTVAELKKLDPDAT